MIKNLSNKPTFLKSIADKVHLREGADGVEAVLRAIFQVQSEAGSEPLDERTLARIARFPMPVVNAVRWELQNAGVLDSEGPGIRLSLEAMDTIHIEWGWSPPKKESKATWQSGCQVCDGTGVAPTGPQWEVVTEALRRNLEKLYRSKSPVTPEAEIRRVAFMHDSGSLIDKDVLVMGEGVSAAAGIALAGKALSQTGKLARRVVALHPNERTLSGLRDLAVREGTIVGLVKHDPRRSLMQDLEGEFDSIFVAPSSIFSSMVNYLARSIEAAKPKGGRIFFAAPPLSLDDRVDLQRAILDLGLAIERLVPGFEKYEGNTQPGDMYVLSVTEEAGRDAEG